MSIPDRPWIITGMSYDWIVRREGSTPDDGTQTYYTPDELTADAFCDRLNDLDRLRRIEALALAWHHAILATNGVYDAEQALRTALQPQEPTQ